MSESNNASWRRSHQSIETYHYADHILISHVNDHMSKEGDFDFTMRIYNSDGSEPEMCGNGIRCFAQFLKDLGEDGKQFFVIVRVYNDLLTFMHLLYAVLRFCWNNTLHAI